MSDLTGLLVGIGITTYGSGLATVGWAMRTNISWRTEIRKRLDSLDGHITQSSTRGIDLDRDIESLKRTVPPLRETVAVLASELENVVADVRELSRQVDQVRDRLGVPSTRNGL